MMTLSERPRIFGAGLIALDLVIGIDPTSPVKSWAGGTCGNVLSILAYHGWDAYPIARMNSDPASERVRADMARWGVRLNFANCAPTSPTPIIIQEIKRGRDGVLTHRFSWSCPNCGQWLPAFKPITRAAVEVVEGALSGAAVFFFDRLSRATLLLAARASAEGAVVVFEPSGKADERLFAEAVNIAHIVKYSEERLGMMDGFMNNTALLVEIQTLGSQGLKFRHRFGRTLSDWVHLAAIPAPRLADACGSGDWCTAGLLARVAVNGLTGLRRAGLKGIRDALRYGQTLSAWNCGFEGARGAMYAVDQEMFSQQVKAFIAGRPEAVVTPPIVDEIDSVVACPACP